MIELRSLERRFGDKLAVRDLSLSVDAGELFGFLGPNGAGKTTTIRMLCGLLRPSRGELRIDGHDYAAGAAHVRSVIALVPDTPPLYDYLTGRQYIAFVASLHGVDEQQRDARSADLLDALGLTDRADDLCKAYSHGMRKKIHIAAMLTTAPKVLFLDEPTAGLDPRSARALKDLLIDHRKRGVTIFLSTHQLDIAQEICDRVAIMNEGQLIAIGSMAELQSQRRDSSNPVQATSQRSRGRQPLEDVFLRLVAETEGSTEEVSDVDPAQG